MDFCVSSHLKFKLKCSTLTDKWEHAPNFRSANPSCWNWSAVNMSVLIHILQHKHPSTHASLLATCLSCPTTLRCSFRQIASVLRGERSSRLLNSLSYSSLTIIDAFLSRGNSMIMCRGNSEELWPILNFGEAHHLYKKRHHQHITCDWYLFHARPRNNLKQVQEVMC